MPPSRVTLFLKNCAFGRAKKSDWLLIISERWTNNSKEGGPLLRLCWRVKSGKKLTILKDDPCNRVLECALSGTSDVIVTDDKAMLAIGTHKERSHTPQRCRTMRRLDPNPP